MKILVADDSTTTLALLCASLQKLGHEVIPAQSGQAAIELFQTSSPDLIILDVVMESMSGFECAKHIRALEKDDWIPIIFLSASVDDASIAQGIDAGGDDYLTKPFSEITLSAKIKAMQRIAKMRRNLYEATQKLSLLSSTDTLTGIYNRLQFNKTIQEKIAEATRQHNTFALLFLDLDKFKEVNDVYGHHMGDLLLVEVSTRLQSCLRLDDFLCRMGGDEFAIILNNIEEIDTVTVVSEKIIQTLSAPYHLDKRVLNCSCSLGIVLFPTDGTDQESLTQHADIAMYHAKNTGKNNFQYYNASLNMTGNEHPPSLEPSQPKASPRVLPTTVLNCLVKTTHVCIDLEHVIKNVPLPQLKPLPNGPAYVIGLMNFRGKSVPVVDLGTRLGLERQQPYSLDTPMLLCDDGFNQVGFVVDKVLGLCDINPENIQKEVPEQTTPDFIATITIDGALSLLVNMPYLLSVDSFETT